MMTMKTTIMMMIDANDGIEELRIVSKRRAIKHIDYTEAEANTDNNDDTES